MKTLTILILIMIGCTQAQFEPTAILYSSQNGVGDSVNIPATQHVFDLEQYQFDDRAQSVCLTGTWLFYDGLNFNMNGNAAMEYIFDPNNYCINFEQVGGYVSSVRPAGSAFDYRSDSITFYEEAFFQKEAEYAVEDLSRLRLSGRISSLIVTGSSDWTVYDEPNFGGKAICLRVNPTPEYSPAFVSDTLELNPTVPHGSIASVKKGCYTKNVIFTPSFNSKIPKVL